MIQMPVSGVWKLVNSPGHAAFAYDLAAVDATTGKTLSSSRFQHLMGHVTAEDSFSWSQPVYSPVTGVVVRANDGYPDRIELNLFRDLWALVFGRPELRPDDLSPFAGNHVIIESGGKYVFLAHFQSGSVQVSEGETVNVGDAVARIGNSGMSLEPHLHLQFFDQIDDLLSATAPAFTVEAYERFTEGAWELVENSEFKKGDIIRSVEPSG